jgi:hypothetical protein
MCFRRSGLLTPNRLVGIHAKGLGECGLGGNTRQRRRSVPHSEREATYSEGEKAL